MAEKDFQAELLRGLRAYGGVAYKIEDAPKAQLMRGGANQRPYDCWWQHAGVYHAIECKQEPWRLDVRCEVNNGKKTPGLQGHQEAALLAVSEQRGMGWVICHFHGPLSQREQKRWGRKTLDRAVAVRIEDVVAERQSSGARTLDFDWFASHGVELTLSGTGKDRAWDPGLLVTAARSLLTPARLVPQPTRFAEADVPGQMLFQEAM